MNAIQLFLFLSLSLFFLVLVYDNYKCPILYSKQLRQSIYKLAQCSKTVMTPLKNRGRTRAIEGYFFNENLRPKLQLDVIGY
jgi:hypothetical protein